MVALECKLLLSCSCIALLSLTTASLVENLINSIDPCEDVCQKTYPSHTYDKSFSGACCSRGCRLFSILELIGEVDGVNDTITSCYENCKEAYPTQLEDASACRLGCNSQKPFTNKWKHFDLESGLLGGDVPHLINPFHYMHKMYSDMKNQVTQYMSVSWSFFLQDGTAKLVIIKSQPQVTDAEKQDVFVNRGTSSVLETNIESADNTATQVLGHSQLKSAKGLADEVSMAEAGPWMNQQKDGASSDWLTCIAHKTGMPRLLLSIIVLISAVALIWLCMSAVVTAPEQRLPQKLSICSNLDSFPDQKSFKGILPQDIVEARPLPAKLIVQKI